jgi:hypothetical protein
MSTKDGGVNNVVAYTILVAAAYSVAGLVIASMHPGDL